MELTIIRGSDLYCTFTEEDINKFFSMSFDEFSKNQNLVKRFADIIIGKALKTKKIEDCEGRDFCISLYQIGVKKYSIALEREN